MAGPGRPKGVRSKFTLDREQRLAESRLKIKKMLGRYANDFDAHEFLLSIYMDTRKAIEDRLEAARIAIGYEKPKLQSVAVENEGGKPFVIMVDPGDEKL